MIETLRRPDRDCKPRLGDYEREYATYRVNVPERFNAVSAIVDDWAAGDPDAVALLSLGNSGETTNVWTIAEVARESRIAARVLTDVGVSRGDHVLVMLPARPEWHAVMLGCMRIGAVPVPSPNLLTPKDIHFRIQTARATAAVTDAAGAEKVDASGATPAIQLGLPGSPPGWHDWSALCARVGDGDLRAPTTHRDDPLLLYFTSGTVANPKMVRHPHSYALGHIGTARFWHDLRPGDLHWTIADTGWAKAAWGALFGQWHERACVVQATLASPDPALILQTLARHRITSFCAPPTLYRRLVRADLGSQDLSALRHCTSAGEPLNPEVIHVWKQSTGGLTIYEGYGQTETTCVIANYRSSEVRPGSMGRPMPGWQMAVVDDDGAAVETGTVGHVVVRLGDRPPVGLFPGYYEDAAATARCFRDGCYYTGDKAARDPDGYVWFEGRGDDVITSSAYRIGPFEVESALVAHPAVVEAAVVGRADSERTQIVVAICTLADGWEGTPELGRQLQDFVKQSTAPYKYPREVHFVSELPKTVSGKIRRSELRAWLDAGRLPGAGHAVDPRPDVAR